MKTTDKLQTIGEHINTTLYITVKIDDVRLETIAVSTSRSPSRWRYDLTAGSNSTHELEIISKMPKQINSGEVRFEVKFEVRFEVKFEVRFEVRFEVKYEVR